MRLRAGNRRSRQPVDRMYVAHVHPAHAADRASDEGLPLEHHHPAELQGAPDPQPGSSQVYNVIAVFTFEDQLTDIGAFVDMGKYARRRHPAALRTDPATGAGMTAGAPSRGAAQAAADRRHRGGRSGGPGRPVGAGPGAGRPDNGGAGPARRLRGRRRPRPVPASRGGCSRAAAPMRWSGRAVTSVARPASRWRPGLAWPSWLSPWPWRAHSRRAPCPPAQPDGPVAGSSS